MKLTLLTALLVLVACVGCSRQAPARYAGFNAGGVPMILDTETGRAWIFSSKHGLRPVAYSTCTYGTGDLLPPVGPARDLTDSELGLSGDASSFTFEEATIKAQIRELTRAGQTDEFGGVLVRPPAK